MAYFGWVSGGAEFQLETDAGARAWMEAHPSEEPRVIEYDVHRCCGGGKICQVRVRNGTRGDDLERYTVGSLTDGTKILIDRRAATRLPSRFGLTVRGRGPLRRLDLSLDSQQWGDLLYS
jgi:hypothetical protein